MKKVCELLILFLFVGWGSVLAQSRVVKGTVMDEKGETLIGVPVFIKGTSQGTVTNIDGRYVLPNLSEKDTLVISYIGFARHEQPVGANEQIDVVLKSDLAELEEVQVVAFQKQKKESVIGSITTIKPADLKQPNTNLTNSLAGRIAGVVSYQRSGEPGADNAEFFIRGVTSFGYKNSPLILLDGFEISSSDLARVEPDNVASFSIMKDATATSLYGSRGANGVIMVTTKQGKRGKAVIEARIETALAAPTMTNKFLGGVDYMNLYNQATRTRDPNAILLYSKDKIENTRNGVNQYVFPNVDWYNELFKDYTMNTKANVNVNGGGEIARYYLSVAYTNETGLLNVDNMNNFNNNIDIDRYNIRANVDVDLTKTTVASVKLYSLFDRYNGPADSASNIFKEVMNANPVNFPKFFPKTEETAYLNHTLFGNKGNGNYANPYADMVKGYKDEFTSTILSQFQIEQDFSFITEGLSARGMASIKTYSSYGSNRSFDPFYYAVQSYDPTANTYDLYQVKEGTEYLKAPVTHTNANSRAYFEVAGMYNRSFEKHAVGALLVFTQEERLNTVQGNDVYASLPARNMGLAGRMTYAFDNRYFTEANFGYNGSERFAEKNRFGFFPSVGLGWSVSSEKFWEPLIPYVNQLKFKASYGKVGNDAIAKEEERFLYLSSVNLNDATRGYSWGQDFNNSYSGYTVNRYPNPEVTWEVADKLNVGFELGLWGKATIQADYFAEERNQIYMENKYVPSTMGLSAPIKSNIGQAKSSGIDGSMDYAHSFNKDLWLTGRANFTYARNEMVANGEPAYQYAYMSRIGQPLDQQWGLIAERLFVDEEDVRNSPVQTYGNNYTAGDIKYKDVNNDGKIDDNDMVPIGFPKTPEIIYGFGLSAGYKNVDFSFFFQGSARSSFYIDPKAISPFVNERNALEIIANDHWSDENPDPYAFWPRLSTETIENNTQSSTWWLRDGSFLRLKSVELGYSLPNRFTDKIKIKDARFYVSGTNLLTFSKFKLWDPEMGGNGLGYPPQMIFNFGVHMAL